MDISIIICASLLPSTIVKISNKTLGLTIVRYVYGIAGESFAAITFTVPLLKVLQHPKGAEIIANAITEKVMPKLVDGKVLNNNIPEEILVRAGLKGDQYVKPSVDGLIQNEVNTKNELPRNLR